MSTAVTEIAFVPIRKDADIDNTSSEDGKKWKSIVNSCDDVPGYMHAFIGRQVEDESTIVHLLDWESLESHHNFINHPSYAPMMADLETLQNGDGIFYHAYLRSPKGFSPTTLFQTFQPVVPAITELRTFHFAPDISPSDSSAFEEAFSGFCHEALGIAQPPSCVAGGWVLEDLESKEIHGGRAKGFCVITGWESVEEHTAFRKCETYNAFPGFEAQAKRSEIRGARLAEQ